VDILVAVAVEPVLSDNMVVLLVLMVVMVEQDKHQV
jgi:hypothetical protein